MIVEFEKKNLGPHGKEAEKKDEKKDEKGGEGKQNVATWMHN